MAVIKAKPTSPGRRFRSLSSGLDLYKGRSYAPLTQQKSKSGGRNNNGRITTRHIGGGHKHHYRVIDFKRNKDGIPAVVERIEYDPNRSAFIALVLYEDGERKYIIAPKGLKEGSKVVSGADAECLRWPAVFLPRRSYDQAEPTRWWTASPLVANSFQNHGESIEIQVFRQLRAKRQNSSRDP